MNFLKGKVIHKDGEMFVSVGKDKIQIPLILVQKLISGYFIGKQIILGIRPEDIKEIATQTTDSKIEGIIEMVELMGAESHLHINYQNQIIIIRVNGTTDKKKGDKMAVYLDAQRIHLFDIQTEMRI